MLWGMMILFFSLLPGRDIPKIDIINFDKFVHAVIYGVWVFILLVGFHKQHSIMKLRYNAGKSALLIAFIYGTIIEVLQELLFEDRYFDLMDISANMIGGITGSLLFTLIYFKL